MAFDLLDTQTLGADNAQINFTGLAPYSYYIVRGYVRSSLGAANQTEFGMRLGGASIDTGNNYRWDHHHISGGGAGSSSDSSFGAGRYTIPASGTTGGVFAEFNAMIYTATGVARLVQTWATHLNIRGGMTGFWTDTSTTISKIRFFDRLGGNLLASSHFEVYGTDTLPMIADLVADAPGTNFSGGLLL